MKNRILESAEKRFFEYGYRKVTMDEIASDLGISKKTLYAHVKSKDAAAIAVIRALHKDIDKLLKQFSIEITDPVERLCRMITEVSIRLTRIGSLFLADIKKDIPDLWRECEDYREKKILEYGETILKEGIRKGKVKKDINTKIAMLVFLGAIHAVIQPEVFVKNPFSIDEAYKNILNIFLKGIQK